MKRNRAAENYKKKTDEILGSCHDNRTIGKSESDGKHFWRERKGRTPHEIYGWPYDGNGRRTEEWRDATDNERLRSEELHVRQRL